MYYTVFVFRRDLRIVDNTAFRECVAAVASSTTSTTIIPLFIYNHATQADPRTNPYHSSKAFAFMNQCLDDLEHAIEHLSTTLSKDVRLNERVRLLGLTRLHHRPGDGTEADTIVNAMKRIGGVVATSRLKAVFFNRDLTPYAVHRDLELRAGLCRITHGTTEVISTEDYTLLSVEDTTVKTKAGGTYKVFGPFYANRTRMHGRISRPDPGPDVVLERQERKSTSLEGGRDFALRILERVRGGSFADYASSRDDLGRDVQGTSTTRLSAYLKFGCVSVREAYWAMHDAYGLDHALVRELFFREFYYHLTWNFPHVLRGMVRVHPNSDVEDNLNQAFSLSLSTGSSQSQSSNSRPDAYVGWKEWTEGCTGTPLVDAAMRQLETTGFMHNRGRMVVAMYLTKDLLLDWRDGERHFATRLVDYDPVQNSAGWQWSAGVGADAAPYFRVFNPYLQQARFDPSAEYVKRWVPELRSVDPRHVRTWEDPDVRLLYPHVNYPAPIVPSHAVAAKRAIATFRRKRKP